MSEEEGRGEREEGKSQTAKRRRREVFPTALSPTRTILRTVSLRCAKGVFGESVSEEKRGRKENDVFVVVFHSRCRRLASGC